MEDTSPEMKKLQFDLMMRLGLDRRVELAGEMFMAVRHHILATLPAGSSRRAELESIYRHTYGEELPSDFFPGDIK